MSKKNVAIAVAVAAMTFIILLMGSKFYDVYALENPLSQQLTKYHINKMEYNQQAKTVILYLKNDSDIISAINDVTKKFGDVKIELQDNSSQQLNTFYQEEELYVMQYIDARQYGTLRDYLKEKAKKKDFNLQISIDDNYIYIKLSDEKTALYKIFPRWKERGV